MGRRSIAVLCTTVLALLFAASVSAANLIAYSKWSANKHRVMVMDETGTNPIELHVGGKFSPITPQPSISPPGHNGTWITFNDYYEIYRIRPDGSDSSMVLCGEGTDIDGNDYSLLWGSEWSPDRSGILVYRWTEAGHVGFGFLPAASMTEPDVLCSDRLEPITYPQDGEWGFEGTVAWNDDGTQIAFFEFLNIPEEGGDVRLAILKRQGTDWVRLPEHPLDPRPVYPEVSHLLSLDWQRGGNQIAFVVRDDSGRRPNFWLALINSTDGSWEYLTENGNRVEGFSPSWSPDGQQLVFSDSGDNLIKWTLADGTSESLGSGESADWQRDPLRLDCNITGCDDGNPCTIDSCNQTTGECEAQPEPIGTTCSDGNECTDSDQCNDTGLCVGDAVFDDSPCDLGAGICCGGFCSTITCEVSADCSDGNDCTDDFCFNGNTCAAYCQNDPIQGCVNCLPKGATCSTDGDCCNNKCRGGKCR